MISKHMSYLLNIITKVMAAMTRISGTKTPAITAPLPSGLSSVSFCLCKIHYEKSYSGKIYHNESFINCFFFKHRLLSKVT